MTKENTKETYTVHCDYGTDAWVWMKPSDDATSHIGRIVADYNGWYTDQAISDELIEAFNQWMLVYERSKVYSYENILKFDWLTFEKKGLILAKKLKLELPDATVRYLKPSEDPDYNWNARLEVLSNGEIIEVSK